MEADVKPDTKTRKRTEGVVAADRAKYIGDSSSSKKFNSDMTSLISFGMMAESPALSLSDDTLVDKGAAAPKLCLSSVEMRTLTAAGALFPAGLASTVTRTTFHQPPLWFYPTQEMNFRTTSIQYATTFNSLWKIKGSKTKTRQTLVFDSGRSTCRLRACPFWGGWRALLCGEIFVCTLRWYPKLEQFWYTEDLNILFKNGKTFRYATYVLRSIPVSPKPDGFEGAAKVRWHVAMEAAGIKYVRERHGARSLMARNSTERLRGEYNLESRRFAFSCTASQ